MEGDSEEFERPNKQLMLVTKIYYSIFFNKRKRINYYQAKTERKIIKRNNY